MLTFCGVEVMRKKSKLRTIIVICIFLGTIFGTYVPIRKVQADNPEIPLDLNFIEEIAQALAYVADQDENWKGRAYGSSGEIEAAEYLEQKWHDYLSVYDLSIEEINFTDLPPEKQGGWVNDKLDISPQKNFHLYVGSEEIDQEEYQPIPCLTNRFQDISDDYTVRIPPEHWYINLNEIGKSLLERQLKENQMFFEFEYTSLNKACGVIGNIVYIEDYESASIEDTDGRIHLVEIEQNATDDTFNDTVNTACEYNGTGVIIMTTNPTLINKTNTVIPGIAISRYDGEKLKEIIEENNETIVEIEGDPIPQEGTLKVYSHKIEPGCLGNDIYLIDADLARKHGWVLRGPSYLANVMFFWSWLPGFYPSADAFF